MKAGAESHVWRAFKGVMVAGSLMFAASAQAGPRQVEGPVGPRVDSQSARRVTGPSDDLRILAGDPTGMNMVIELRPMFDYPGGTYSTAGCYDQSNISGNTLTIPTGPCRTYWNVFLSNWDPNGDRDPPLSSWQARVDAAGYASGAGGDLVTASQICTTSSNCTTAFGESGSLCSAGVCRYAWANKQATRTDQFRGDLLAPDCTTIWDTSVLLPAGPLFLGANQPEPCNLLDPGVVVYGGTMALDVPGDAQGTYTLPFVDSETFATDPNLFIIPLAARTPGTLVVGMCGNNTVEGAEECDGSLSGCAGTALGCGSACLCCDADVAAPFGIVNAIDLARVVDCVDHGLCGGCTPDCDVNGNGVVNSTDISVAQCAVLGVGAACCSISEPLAPESGPLAASKNRFLAFDFPPPSTASRGESSAPAGPPAAAPTALRVQLAALNHPRFCCDTTEAENPDSPACDSSPGSGKCDSDADCTDPSFPYCRPASLVCCLPGDPTDCVPIECEIDAQCSPPHSDCLHSPSTSITPGYAAFEGKFRYVNSFTFPDLYGPLDCADDGAPFHTSYKCARLGCEPEYRDWTSAVGVCCDPQTQTHCKSCVGEPDRLCTGNADCAHCLNPPNEPCDPLNMGTWPVGCDGCVTLADTCIETPCLTDEACTGGTLTKCRRTLIVVGDAVAPSSTLEVTEIVEDPCGMTPDANFCVAATQPLAIHTAAFGDVVGPANGPPDGKPQVIDFAAIKDKLVNPGTAFPEYRLWLKDRSPDPREPGAGAGGVNVLDLAQSLNAIKGLPFLSGQTTDIDACAHD